MIESSIRIQIAEALHAAGDEKAYILSCNEQLLTPFTLSKIYNALNRIAHAVEHK